MNSGKEVQELLEQVEEQTGDWRVALEQAQDKVTAAEGHEVVIFEWSTEKGACYDCGIPAAYRLTDPAYAQWPQENLLLCSVDAAHHAAQGEGIEYLFQEEDRELETQ